MKTYRPKATVQAEPMSRRDYAAKHAGNNLSGYHIIDDDGFEGWHPKEAFENDFKEARKDTGEPKRRSFI